MFERDYDIFPRTYSIKSYKRKGAISFKKVFAYLCCFIILIVGLGVALLSAAHLI